MVEWKTIVLQRLRHLNPLGVVPENALWERRLENIGTIMPNLCDKMLRRNRFLSVWSIFGGIVIRMCREVRE